MRHCVAVADLDFGAVFGAGAKQCADYTLLVRVAAQGVVEDGKYGLDGKLASSMGERGQIGVLGAV